MRDMLSLCGITIDQLVALYEREQSVVRVADKLGVSRPTATKWCRIAGIKTIGHRPVMKPTASMAGEFGLVSQWIRNNPGKKLPRNAKEAADEIGCKKNTLSCYLYRRKKRVLRYLESFGDLREMEAIIVTTNDRNVRTRYIDEYSYKFNPRTFMVLINFSVSGTNMQAEYPLKKLLSIFKGTAI